MTYGQPSAQLMADAQTAADNVDRPCTQAIYYGDNGWSFDDANSVPRGAWVALVEPTNRWHRRAA